MRDDDVRVDCSYLVGVGMATEYLEDDGYWQPIEIECNNPREGIRANVTPGVCHRCEYNHWRQEKEYHWREVKE